MQRYGSTNSLLGHSIPVGYTIDEACWELAVAACVQKSFAVLNG